MPVVGIGASMFSIVIDWLAVDDFEEGLKSDELFAVSGILRCQDQYVSTFTQLI